MSPNEGSLEPERGGLKRKAAGLADKARSAAKDTLEDMKDSVASRADRVADAVERGSERASEQEPTLAGHVSHLADGMHRLAGRLRDRSISELLADAQLLARRHPVLFVVGSLALGVAAARFMKASSAGAGAMEGEEAWREDYQRASQRTTKTPGGAHYAAAAQADAVGMGGAAEPSSRHQKVE
jgi:hypothetical protein